MSLSTSRIAPLAVLLLMAAATPALGQSQVVSTEVIRPTQEDLEVTGVHFNVNFGASVALSGRTAAIGIPHDVEDASGGGGSGPGRVGIYSKTQAGWMRTATLLPSNASDVRFGRDVDVCGNLLVVAAENSTYVFRRRGAHWREIKRIGLPSPDNVLGPIVCSNDSFAQSVSTRNDQGERIAATVHMYEQRGGGDFELVSKLRASDPNDSIGRSLAMRRAVLVAGSEPDAAYVFVRHGHRWIERQKLQGTGPNGAGIGAAVAIRDRIIIAGAPDVELSDEPFSGVDGDAFVYLPHRGSWFESQTLNDPPLPGLQSSGRFGSAVAMGRRLVAVSAPFTAADEIRPESAVIVLDRVGEHFTFARRVFAAGGDSQTIPDIDMSGHRLILSVQESRNPNIDDRVVGRAVILQFEPSPEPATQTDEEEADEP